MARSRPFFEQVQAHYDLSDEFFALFLDPSRTYSCAYFQRDDMTLEEAQQAKIDLSLGKCDLHPGMRLVDIGCGWGATARRAAERHGVNVIGLTLSENQWRHNEGVRKSMPVIADQLEFRLQGWEEFDEPADRIVSIGAFEHFRMERYEEFFAKCRDMLADADPAHGPGRMLLHTIVQTDWRDLRRAGVPITHEDVTFAKFIREKIFPGGQLCTPAIVVDHAQRAGFRVTQTQSLRLHYARTLDIWAANLEGAQARAIELTSEDTYEMYMKYLTGCARYFRSGHNDIIQFTCVRA